MRRTSAGESLRPARAVGVHRADDHRLERRLVLFEIERDLLVAHLPHQRAGRGTSRRGRGRRASETRKPRIDDGLKRSASRAYADAMSATTVAAMNPTAPAAASFIRQRLRTCRMTSIRPIRGSLVCRQIFTALPPEGRSQDRRSSTAESPFDLELALSTSGQAFAATCGARARIRPSIAGYPRTAGTTRALRLLLGLGR